MVTRSFTLYKGFRIHLLEEADFRKDATGRYIVCVHIEKPQLDNLRHFEVPQCFASTLEEAQQVSVEQAMRLIDGRPGPMGVKTRRRRAKTLASKT